MAFLVRKGALIYDGGGDCGGNTEPAGGRMTREEIIRRVVERSGRDLVVTTTGKASRELFEIRESLGEAAVGAREDLGRPKGTPSENKALFMEYLRDGSCIQSQDKITR